MFTENLKTYNVGKICGFPYKNIIVSIIIHQLTNTTDNTHQSHDI